MAEINSHKYSDILWLFILGKNLAAQVIFLMYNGPSNMPSHIQAC